MTWQAAPTVLLQDGVRRTGAQQRGPHMCAVIAIRLLMPLSLVLANLLEGAPAGQYFLELVDGWLLLWRLSEGEPDSDALESAICWPWSTAEVA